MLYCIRQMLKAEMMDKKAIRKKREQSALQIAGLRPLTAVCMYGTYGGEWGTKVPLHD